MTAPTPISTLEPGQFARAVTALFDGLSPGPWTVHKNPKWAELAASKEPVDQCKACGEWPVTAGHIVMGKAELKKAAIDLAKGKNTTAVPAAGSLFKIEGASSNDIAFVLKAPAMLKKAVIVIEGMIQSDEKRRQRWAHVEKELPELRKTIEDANKENQTLRARCEQVRGAIRQEERARESDPRLKIKDARAACQAIIDRAAGIAGKELGERIRRACAPLMPGGRAKTA